MRRLNNSPEAKQVFVIWFDNLDALGTQDFERRQWRWCRFDLGSRKQGAGDLAEIGRELEAGSDEVVALLAAKECLDLWVTIPPMHARRIRQAIPYIAEEQVAQPIESMHFAVAERRAQQLHCIGVSRSLLQALLDVMEKFQILPTAMYQDSALIPLKGGQVSVLKDAGRALVRTAESALEVPCDRLEALIDALLDARKDSEGELLIEVIGDEEGELSSISNSGARIRSKRLTGTCLGELLINPRISGANLLVAEFEPIATGTRTVPWKLPIGLAAALLVSLVGSDLIQGYIAKLHASTLIDEAIGIFEAEHPAMEASEDEVIRLIHREQGANSQETQDLIEMMNRASGIFSEHGANARSLSYQAGSNMIDVEVEVLDFEKLDTVESLASENFQEVAMLGATQTPEGIRARLRLSGAGR